MKTPAEFSSLLDEAYVRVTEFKGRRTGVTVDASHLSWAGWDALVAYVEECRQEAAQ